MISPGGLKYKEILNQYPDLRLRIRRAFRKAAEEGHPNIAYVHLDDKTMVVKSMENKRSRMMNSNLTLKK